MNNVDLLQQVVDKYEYVSYYSYYKHTTLQADTKL